MENGCVIILKWKMDVLLLVICNSVKMGIRLCYKGVSPKEMVKVEK
jgi:hypothetical protein